MRPIESISEVAHLILQWILIILLIMVSILLIIYIYQS